MALGYVGLVAAAWLRYGHVSRGAEDEADELLDRFMPRYDVVERHRVRVSAPAAITLSAARDSDLYQSAFIRGIFRAREIAMAAKADEPVHEGLVAAMTSLGWRILAETPAPYFQASIALRCSDSGPNSMTSICTPSRSVIRVNAAFAGV